MFLGEWENCSGDIEFPLYLLRVKGVGHVLQNQLKHLIFNYHLIVDQHNVGLNGN